MSSGSTQFCPSCNNLMMPREERGERKLVYHCKSCNLSQDAAVAAVYRNEVVKSETCVWRGPFLRAGAGAASVGLLSLPRAGSGLSSGPPSPPSPRALL